MSVFWALLCGGVLASIFFVTAYIAFYTECFPSEETNSLRLIVGKCLTWQSATWRILVVAGSLAVVLVATSMLVKIGLSIPTYVLGVTFWVLFIMSRQSIFRFFSYPRTNAFLFATGLSAAWFFFPGWMATGVVSFFLAFFYIGFLKETSIKEAIIFSLAVVLFDVSAVFFFRIMHDVASSAMNTPLVLSVPPVLSFTNLRMVGLGDIVFPGILIMAMFREAKIRNVHLLSVGAVAGYFLGLVVTILIRNVFDTPQPATLYLIPGVLIGAWAVLFVKKLSAFEVLWEGG